MQRTFLVIVSTPDLDSAYRIFSMMNSRGVELSPADIFKSKVVGALPEDLKEKYAGKWEDLEVDLGRDAFGDLFSHIRMVCMKVRARKELLHEFEASVFGAFLPERPAAFVDEVLEPYGQAYRDVLASDYQSVDNPEEINRWLRRLRRLDDSTGSRLHCGRSPTTVSILSGWRSSSAGSIASARPCFSAASTPTNAASESGSCSANSTRASA